MSLSETFELLIQLDLCLHKNNKSVFDIEYVYFEKEKYGRHDLGEIISSCYDRSKIYNGLPSNFEIVGNNFIITPTIGCDGKVYWFFENKRQQ
jgi:hypothetical protein